MNSVIHANEFALDKTVLKILGVFIFILLLTFGAYIRLPLPFTPVPITLQTLFVLLAGAFLGKKYGPMAVFGYIFLGGLGLPIFQGYGSGLFHIFGPTGGYLIGFIVASFLIGLVIESKEKGSLLWIIFAMAIGQIAIYAFGISWLSIIMRLDFIKAAYFGFIPFIPGAIFKLMIASAIYSKFASK